MQTAGTLGKFIYPQSRIGDMVHLTGYMVHLTETCNPGLPRLVVHTDTTPANVHEAVFTGAIDEALSEAGLALSEHLVDAAYMSAEQLVVANARHGIDLIGPNGPIIVGSGAMPRRSR